MQMVSFDTSGQDIWKLLALQNILRQKQLVSDSSVIGHITRIAPNILVTDDPEFIKRQWAVRSKYKKSEWYDAIRFDPSRDNIVSLKDDEQHNVLRAKMAAGVSRRVPSAIPYLLRIR